MTDIQALRASGQSQLAKCGLPSPANEQWKYTNITALARTEFTPPNRAQSATVDQSTIARCILPGGEAARLVFIDGVFSGDHSVLPAESSKATIAPLSMILNSPEPASLAVRGDVLRKLAERANEDDGFVSLNTAMLGEGAVVSLPRGVTVELPIHVVSILTGAVDRLLNPLRNVYLAGENAEAEVIESFFGVSEAPAFTSVVTEVTCERSSRFTVTKIEQENSETYHVGRLIAEIEERATFTSNVFTFGGKLVRNEICPVLRGEHIECHMNGLTALRGEQHVDNDTVLDHAVPNCFSREHYKGIYGDRSSGVFGGTIIVREGAQKTNAIQSNQTLLLSDQATIDTRPQLKIWADDVKCTHGATIGQLDEDALFYIRSRGVGEESARSLLVHAFASDVVQYLRSPAVRLWVENMLCDRLRELLGAGVELGDGQDG